MDANTLAILFAVGSFTVFASLGGTFAYAYRYGPQAVLRRRVRIILNPDEAEGKKGEAPGTSQRRAVQAKLKELEAAGKANPVGVVGPGD